MKVRFPTWSPNRFMTGDWKVVFGFLWFLFLFCLVCFFFLLFYLFFFLFVYRMWVFVYMHIFQYTSMYFVNCRRGLFCTFVKDLLCCILSTINFYLSIYIYFPCSIILVLALYTNVLTITFYVS